MSYNQKFKQKLNANDTTINIAQQIKVKSHKK